MIYTFFTSLSEYAALFDSYGIVLDLRSIALLSIISCAVLLLIMFIFKAIGLYTIGKRENISKPFLAFIPFASIYFMGKIVGGMKLFGHKIKNLGVYVMLAYILDCVLSLSYDILLYGDVILHFVKTGEIITMQANYGIFYVDVLLKIFSALFSITYVVTNVFLIFAFFRYYGGRNQFVFSILSIFLSFLLGVFIFIVRNNSRLDYSQYMKMRFDSYNAPGSAGGFNNPNRPYSTSEPKNEPFADAGEQKNECKNDIDVFEEYSSNNKSNDTNN